MRIAVTNNITKKGGLSMYSHREIIASDPGHLADKRKNMLIVLLFVLVPLSGSMANMNIQANEIEQSKNVIRSLIEVFKSTRYDYGGMGTAHITVGPTGDFFGDKTEKRMIQFKFRDNLSRSDYYYINEEKEKEFVCTWSIHRKGALAYTGGLLTLRKKSYAQFERQFGFDFHPETFTKLCGFRMDAATLLERLLTADKITTNLDDKGILHISFFRESANGGYKFSFDTTQGYRVVSWEIDKDVRIREQTRRQKGSYKAEWANYDGEGWYVKKALYKINNITIEVEITDFRFNPDIPDSEFTADGLNIPIGTDVFDQVLGINYQYGEPAITEVELEDALKKTEFYREHVEEAREGVHSTGGDNSNEVFPLLDKEVEDPETNWPPTFALIIPVFAIISAAIMIKLKFRRGKR